MYNIIADLHTHTLASTHAYSTLLEMVNAARERGLVAIATTDHARSMPGAPGAWFFTCLRELPLLYRGVLLLAGMEANVLDFDGTLDINDDERGKLDWVVASIHKLNLPGLLGATVEKSTGLWLKVAKDPVVNVIGHSGSPEFKYDYERVIPEFGRQGKLVEINSHSAEARPASVENCREIALCCKRHSVPIVVNSDAHAEPSVGDHGWALQMLGEIEFPERLIVNGDVRRFTAYLRQHTNILKNRKDAEEILRGIEHA